eukprot:7082903-Prymnesium_polylepis.1
MERLKLDTYVSLLTLADDCHNLATAPLRAVVREATMKRLLALGKPVFPIVETPLGGKRRVRAFCAASKMLMRTSATKLSEKTQDLLVTHGLHLVSLPKALREVVLKACSELSLSSPVQLSASLLCEHLRTRLPDSALTQLHVVDELLGFVIKESNTRSDCSQAEPGSSAAVIFEMLRDVPLMKLRSGK